MISSYLVQINGFDNYIIESETSKTVLEDVKEFVDFNSVTKVKVAIINGFSYDSRNGATSFLIEYEKRYYVIEAKDFQEAFCKFDKDWYRVFSDDQIVVSKISGFKYRINQ